MLTNLETFLLGNVLPCSCSRLLTKLSKSIMAENHLHIVSTFRLIIKCIFSWCIHLKYWLNSSVNWESDFVKNECYLVHIIVRLFDSWLHLCFVPNPKRTYLSEIFSIVFWRFQSNCQLDNGRNDSCILYKAVTNLRSNNSPN